LFFIIWFIGFLTIKILTIFCHIFSLYWHFLFYGYCWFCHFNQSFSWHTNNLHFSFQTFSKSFSEIDIIILLWNYCT
jgi:hypothetical protein